MGLFNGGKVRADLQALRASTEALTRKNAELEALIIDDIESSIKAGRRYTGNEYRVYDAIITELAKKYQATSEWGCVQAGNIIDVRASFIIGQGITLGPADKDTGRDKPTQDALAWAKAFFEFNDLDREMSQELAKEAEIEGCFLGVLAWDEAERQVTLRFMSRVETKYTIIHPAEDYSWYQEVRWKDGSSPRSLAETEFVYARFGGRVHIPNEPTPKVGKCITEIEALSKALRDWREINRLFGSPVPHVECETADQAKAMKDAITGVANNWKIRKLFAHTGRLMYLTPDAASRQGIENEIITLAKMISGATGVPVHFLGLPDLMSNRATADNLMELVASSTRKEREIWVGTYEQIIEKAASIWNANSAMTPVDSSLVKVSIPAVAPETWKRLTDVWLPLYTADAISKQTFLEQVPGIDAGDEAERLANQQAKNMARFAKGALSPANNTTENPVQGQAGE